MCVKYGLSRGLMIMRQAPIIHRPIGQISFEKWNRLRGSFAKKGVKSGGASYRAVITTSSSARIVRSKIQ